MELGAGGSRHAVHRPDRGRVGPAPLRGIDLDAHEGAVVGRMPVARGDHEVEAVEELVDRPRDPSPSATGSAPPGVKSFWKSTIRRASMDGMVWTSRPGARVGLRMDFLRSEARIVGTPWQERAARSVPGCGRPGRIGLGPRGSVPPPLARRLPGRLPRRPRRRRRRGHRPGGVPCRAARARSVRPLTALRPRLHRIVVNRAIDWARARALRREVGGRTARRHTPRSPEPRPRLNNETLAALAALSPDHRAVVVLRHLLDYTPGEIANLLDLPRGTVNSRLRRGLDALQERVTRETS